jgi:hypothetical protein
MILDEHLGTKLIGYGNYRSSSALVKNLVSKRERLDVIDEISSLFSQMKSGGLYQTEILDELCKLWSDSNTKFLASEYSEKENTSTCYNPCVNILGSSTIEGIKNSIVRLTTTKGLMPRFLIFAHEDYGKTKESFLNELLIDVTVSKLKAITDLEKREKKNKNIEITQGPAYDPFNLAPVDDDAKNYFNQIRNYFSEQIEAPETPEAIRHILTRGKEQVMKLSILHAASRGDIIRLKDLIWAKETFDVCLHNSKMFIEETAIDGGDYEKDLMAVLNRIKKDGNLTTARLANRFKRIPTIKLDSILRHLIQMEKIEQIDLVHKLHKTTNKAYRAI